MPCTTAESWQYWLNISCLNKLPYLTVTFRGNLGTPFLIIPAAPNSQDWPNSSRRSVENGRTLGTCLAFLFHSNWPLWSDSFCFSSLTHCTVENVLFSEMLLYILPNVGEKCTNNQCQAHLLDANIKC